MHSHFIAATKMKNKEKNN